MKCRIPLDISLLKKVAGIQLKLDNSFTQMEIKVDSRTFKLCKYADEATNKWYYVFIQCESGAPPESLSSDGHTMTNADCISVLYFGYLNNDLKNRGFVVNKDRPAKTMFDKNLMFSSKNRIFFVIQDEKIAGSIPQRRYATTEIEYQAFKAATKKARADMGQTMQIAGAAASFVVASGTMGVGAVGVSAITSGLRHYAGDIGDMVYGTTEGGVSLGYIGGFPGTAEIADLNSESDDEEIAQTTAADAAEAAELAEYVTKKSVVGGRYLVWYCNLKPGDETWKYVRQEFQQDLNGLYAIRVIPNSASTVPYYLGGRKWRLEMKVRNVPVKCNNEHCQAYQDYVYWKFTDKFPESYSKCTFKDGRYGCNTTNQIYNFSIEYGGEDYPAEQAEMVKVSCWYCSA